MHAEGGSTMDTDNFLCGDPRAIYRWGDYHGVSLTSYQRETGQIANSAFAVPKEHPFFAYLLGMILRDLRGTDGKFHFINVLCDVGPNRLARAVREYSEHAGVIYPDLCAGQVPNSTGSLPFTWAVYGPSFQFVNHKNDGRALILVRSALSSVCHIYIHIRMLISHSSSDRVRSQHPVYNFVCLLELNIDVTDSTTHKMTRKLATSGSIHLMTD